MIAANFACSLSLVGQGLNVAWAPANAIGNATSPAQIIDVALIDGTIEVPVPAGSVGMVYVPPVPPVANPVAKTLKGASGDTGLPMSTSYPTPYDWEGGTAPANIYITAVGAENGTIYFF